jgi:predicted 3-demethylubiquinone-9 3-methyltransferase (glyoxalase superfamily)
MQKITPCLWFNSEAEKAAKFYTSVFPNSKILTIVPYTIDTPAKKPIGSVMTVSFNLSGHEFMGVNGGTHFKVNPSISFIVGCDTKEEVDELWGKLSQGSSKALMPLDKYPFSEKYGWIQDKYGVSWQLIFTSPEGEERPKIVPSMLFTNEKSGKAEEAVKFYITCFDNSKLGNLMHFEEDQGPSKKGTVMFSDFKLGDVWLAAMDGGNVHEFTFNEAISFIINCKDQEEINSFYDKLSAVPEAEVCGWLKDQYGVSWQLMTEDMEYLSKDKKVMEELLKMKRIDINKLRVLISKK